MGQGISMTMSLGYVLTMIIERFSVSVSVALGLLYPLECWTVITYVLQTTAMGPCCLIYSRYARVK